MNTSKSIAVRIGHVFEGASEKQQEELRWFLDALRANLVDASRALARTAFLLVFAWVCFFAMSVGLVQEVGVGGLKISQISTLLVAGPVIVGFLAYRIGVLLVAEDQLFEAISEVCRYIAPELHKQGLQDWVAPPTFFAIERAVISSEPKGWSGKLAMAFALTVGISFLVLPGIAFAHVVYLLFMYGDVALPLSIAATSIGIIFMVRGLMIWIQNN